MRWTLSSFAFAGARLSRPLPSPVVAFSSLSGVLCVRSVPMGTSAIARYVMMMRRNVTPPPDTVLAAINPMKGEMVPRMVPGAPEERGFFTNAVFAMP